jgi:HD-GYP domain-containing protein (c-di-GMP phosphodiesterase class II)
MKHTDVYTSGHIVRVTQGSVILAKLYGYDEKRVEELDIMA